MTQHIDSKFTYTDINQFKQFLERLQLNQDFLSSASLLKGASEDILRIYEKISNVCSGLLPVSFELEVAEDKENEDYNIEFIVFYLQGDDFVKDCISNTMKFVEADLKRYKGSDRIKYSKFEIKKSKNSVAKLYFEIDN